MKAGDAEMGFSTRRGDDGLLGGKLEGRWDQGASPEVQHIRAPHSNHPSVFHTSVTLDPLLLDGDSDASPVPSATSHPQAPAQERGPPPLDSACMGSLADHAPGVTPSSPSQRHAPRIVQAWAPDTGGLVREAALQDELDAAQVRAERSLLSWAVALVC